MDDLMIPLPRAKSALRQSPIPNVNVPTACTVGCASQETGHGKLLESLTSDNTFRHHLPPYFEEGKLSPLSAVPAQVEGLWDERTTGLPMVVPSEACWRRPPPTFEQVWAEVSKINPRGT
jgi:hypothetical protein